MKDLKYYLALPYSIEITPDQDSYVAVIPDLPGCMSYGDTTEEALRGLEEAKELWLEGRIEAGEDIPEPSEIQEFSGKFVLRIPRSLHKKLNHEARKQGVSLNQYLLYMLSEQHQMRALQSKFEIALNRLVSVRELQHAAWIAPERLTHIRSMPRTRVGGRVNLQMLDHIRKPPRSYRRRQRPTDYGELNNAHT